MEWPWDDWKKDTLQYKVGLIQIASRNKIALFHIGLHHGKTSEDIIAPTLRRIIEDPKVGKVGVNILQADFSRLSRWFGLEPKGAIEASHLYRLVKFGPDKPELVSVKLVSLANQVEDQLGLPLFKGNVRRSNWSQPLKPMQKDYAASDAYAGFMLYEILNEKRLAMRPTPPLPIYAENYPSGKKSLTDPILLDAGDGTTISTEEFFGVKPTKEHVETTAMEGQTATEPLDPTSQALLDELVTRRAILAEKADTPPARIISNTVLEAIARERPVRHRSLLEVKGIGKIQQQKYGDDWLDVVSRSKARNDIEEPGPMPPRLSPRPLARSTTIADPALAFDMPSPVQPKLQDVDTGTSFTMTGIKLDDDEASDSDSSLLSLDFGLPAPSSRTSSNNDKRKRPKSPTKPTTDSTSQPVLQKIRTSSPTTRFLKPMSNKPAKGPTISFHISKPTPLINSHLSGPPAGFGSKLAKSKLLAFSKLVASKLPPRTGPAPPLVTEHTLDLIVMARPQTQTELERIPGVDGLAAACEKTDMDLLRNVIKFVPPLGETT